MHFLTPIYLHLLWLALIPLALWLFRRKAKRVNVSTLLFFRTLAREYNESAWLRALKKWLALALTLLVIVLAVLALARPTQETAGDSPGGVVFMVDASASMAGTDGKSTRLDVAKKLAREHVSSLPDNVVVSLIAFDDKPTVLLSRSRNRREFVRLLEEIRSTPTEGNAEAALVVAKRLAALEQPSQIWHLSDEGFAVAPAAGYRFLDVALARVTNVGITGFQLRRAPLARDRYEGFVRVSAASANEGAVQVTLEARIGGRIAQLRELDLKPGESSSLILPLEGVRGERLELELKCLGDCLGWDNAVVAPLPLLRPLQVAWIAENPDPFTDLALSALVESGRLEIWKGDPKAWPLKDKPDVYVFENWVPDAWPQDRPVLALMPPRSSGPLQVKALPAPGVPYDAVRSVAAEHPVLYRINTSRLSLTQTAVFDAGSTLQALWMAGSEPVLAAGEYQGQRVVAAVFSPSRSEQLALMPAYPLLLGNALYWCAENSETMSELKPQRTGALLPSTSSIQWQTWDGNVFTTAVDEPQGGWQELKRIGAWEFADGRAGACVLASTQETDVKKQVVAAAADRLMAAPHLVGSLSSSQWLIGLLLALLLVESFLFHRKAVY